MWHVEVNRDNGTIGFARYDSYPDSGGAKLPIGTWTHVAVTFDGTTARFYLNGVQTGSGSFSFGLDTEAALHFGSDDPNGGNAFNGALDEVRLYDKALSAAEILKLARQVVVRRSRVLLPDGGTTAGCFGACPSLGQAPLFSTRRQGMIARKTSAGRPLGRWIGPARRSCSRG